MRVAVVAPPEAQEQVRWIAEGLLAAGHEVFQLQARDVTRTLTDVLLTRAEVLVPYHVEPALVACVKEFGVGVAGADARTRLYCENEPEVRRTLDAFKVRTSECDGETIPILVLGDGGSLRCVQPRNIEWRLHHWLARETVATEAYRALGLTDYGIVELTPDAEPAVVRVRCDALDLLHEERFWVQCIAAGSTPATMLDQVVQRARQRSREI